MYTLESDSLRVALLDPEADATRMGPRYSTGGYIFQVEDDGGPLLSGPTYPESFNWFDGQGIPDSFALSPLRDLRAPGPRALIPGIGVCDTDARSIVQPCAWDVSRATAGPDGLPDGSAIRFRTAQEWQGFELDLERIVQVAGRTIRSETVLRNTGRAQLPVRWFPHPFYPLPTESSTTESSRNGTEVCLLPAPVRVPDGSTFNLAASGFLVCRDFAHAGAVGVRCGGGAPLTVLVRHPRLGLVAARYTFAPGHVLVWSNRNTFSFEPYLEQTLAGGGELAWSADYYF